MTQEARYYYDCPIKAAFMNWYHGIEYTNDFSSEYEYHNDGTNSRDFRVEGISRIYIHQESLPLLQPQDGDVGCWKEKWSGHRDEGEWYYDRFGVYAANPPYTANDYRPPMHTIIQRNGTPFIMPERGE